MSIENVFNTAWYYSSKYLFGDDVLVGLWFLLIFFGMIAQFKVEFSLGLAFLVPLIIVFMAKGSISLAIGAIYLFLVAVMLGFSWWQNR